MCVTQLLFYMPEICKEKLFIDNQKVQVNNETKRDIWKFLVSSDAAEMLDITMCITFIPVHNTNPASHFICQGFEKKNHDLLIILLLSNIP